MMGDTELIPTFRRFDYRVRMNKGTERKMLTEIFRRLASFESLGNYRYIGFGATTFTDFILFHKELNISDMISIEKYEEFEKRCVFNKPFDCIKIKSGTSNDVLPKLSWEKRVIAWLDYDGRLTDMVAQDISYAVSRVKSGSMVVVTVGAEGYSTRRSETEEQATIRLRNLFKSHSKLRLPEIYRSKHLQGIDMAKTCLNLIEDIIRTALYDRNGNSDENKMQYRPLTNFVYQDGLQMLTAGGLFYETKDEKIVEQCQFDNLEFTLPKEKNWPYQIKMPIITPRERHYLDQKLPTGTYNEAIAEFGLTQEEIDNYIRLYRYCPSYAEVGLI